MIKTTHQNPRGPLSTVIIVFPAIKIIKAKATLRVYPLPCWELSNKGAEKPTKKAASKAADCDFSNNLPASHVRGIIKIPAAS